MPSLTVAVPLFGAALIVGLTAVAHRRLVTAVAIACAATTASITLVLLFDSVDGSIVYWFGGWQPRDGVAFGISLAVEPIGASMATLAGVLAVGALVYSIRYFERVSTLYHPLVLVFLAATVGLCLTGDLFNLFVFFELMSVTAFALTAYSIEQAGPLQGALNFAVTNTIGAFLVLWGIALLYARTGALNLAEIGQALARESADGLIVVAFVLLGMGFLIKAAILPFHFWLADAYASAPIPMNVVFAGVMSELGLYAFARVYWSAFEGALEAAAAGLRPVLVGAGAATALVGGVMCFAQRRLKRMLAFAVVSHAGLFFMGIALFTPGSLGGAIVYMVCDGLVKASLFMCIGIVQHRLGDVDEVKLRGRGRALGPTAALFVIGGLGLAGMPPISTFLGKGLIEEEAVTLGYSWALLVFVAASVLTGGAVLRAAGRIFAGWGPATDERDPHAGEDPIYEEHHQTPGVMWVPALVLAVVAIAATSWPQMISRAEAAAEDFQDRTEYIDLVLHGKPSTPSSGTGSDLPGVVPGLVSGTGAVGIALVALFADRLPRVMRHGWGQWTHAAIFRLRGLHSGHIGDYVAWLTLGVAVYGGLIAAVAL